MPDRAHRWVVLACLAVLGTWSSPGHADFISPDILKLGDVEVGIRNTSPGGRTRATATNSFQIDIDNKGSDRRLRIELIGAFSTERRVQVAGGQQRHVTIHLPGVGGPTTVRVIDEATGKQKEQELHRAEYMIAMGRIGPLSTALNASNEWAVVTDLDDPLPDGWRAWSGFDVIVAEHAYLAKSARAREMALDWVLAGGRLVAVVPPEATWEVPPLFDDAPLREELVCADGERSERIGYGLLRYLPADRLADVQRDFVEAQVETCGAPGRPSSQLPTLQLEMYRDELAARLGDAGEPAGWSLWTTLLIFSIIVGPVGVGVLVRRRGKPLLYLGFVIAVSVLFCSGLVLTDMLARGIRPQGVARSVHLIDQARDVELGVADLTLFATTRGGTKLSAPSQSEWLMLRDYETTSKAKLLVQGERAIASDVVAPRKRNVVGAWWLGRASGKLVVAPQDSQLRIENHLGAAIRQLVVWHDELPYAVRDVAAGATAMATPVSYEEAVRLVPNPPNELFAGDASDRYRAIVAGELGPDRFVADLANAPRDGLRSEADLVEVARGTHLFAGLYQ